MIIQAANFRILDAGEREDGGGARETGRVAEGITGCRMLGIQEFKN